MLYFVTQANYANKEQGDDDEDVEEVRFGFPAKQGICVPASGRDFG